MKILLLCTAHSSLSQRLYLTLTLNHEVTIEYALSTDSMVEAVTLAHPHLIICPFLTSFVPAKIYTKCMTLVVHPGAPGDGGPSALEKMELTKISKELWAKIYGLHTVEATGE
jgi:hypothetical protein